jgi:hypothetical protein
VNFTHKELNKLEQRIVNSLDKSDTKMLPFLFQGMSPEEVTAFANAKLPWFIRNLLKNKWVPAFQRHQESVDAIANPAIEPLHRRPPPPSVWCGCF